MDMIWKNWRINAEEMLVSLAIMLGGSLFGMIVVAGVVMLSDADSYIVLGSFIALIIWITVVVFIGATGFERRFSMAVAMGRTRKEVFVSLYVVQQINILIGIAAIAGLDILETALGRLLYPGLLCEFSIVRLISPCIVIIAAFALPVVHVFFGMLLAKFQKKAFWALWVLWMISSLSSSNIANALSDEPHGIFAGISGPLRGIARFLIDIGVYGQLALAAFICLALLVVTGQVLGKQEVTQV